MSNQSVQSYHEGAYKSLMRGLTELDLSSNSIPCDLLLSGDHAFPLVMNSQGQVLMAASRYGKGRIVVLGHEAYLYSFPALVENALTWLRGDGSENLTVGFHKAIQGVTDGLNKSNFQVKVVGSFSEDKGVGVYVTDAYTVGPEAKELVAFLKAGGGLLMGGQAWHWAYCNPNKNAILQFSGNKVSGVAGIYFTTHVGKAGLLTVPPQIPSSWMALRTGDGFVDDLEVLLQGVSDLKLHEGSTGSTILVHGPLAFPIGTTDDGKVFLAGSYYGKGRVIVASHEVFLLSQGMLPFWRNSLHWLDQGRKGIIGGQPNEYFLQDAEIEYEETQFREDLSVFVCTSYGVDDVEGILNFVAEGGGLVIAGHVWSWAMTHPEQNFVSDAPGNKTLNKMGLTLLNGYISGAYKAPVPSQAITDTSNFRSFLQSCTGLVTKGEKLPYDNNQLIELLTESNYFLKMKAYDSYSYIHVLAVITDLLKSNMPQVSVENPVEDSKDLLLLGLATEVFNFSQDPSALLPHLIKNIPVLPTVSDQRITIDADSAEGEQWFSTGLYLSPGMQTKMTLPAELVNKGWTVQIGCQTDTLKHKQLKRAPTVYKRLPITSGVMQVSNLWGGPIYLVAPPNTEVHGAEVVVQTAVSAPYYKSGVTTTADWLKMRTAPSPWAEFEFENVILTVSSEVVRDLKSLDKVEELWNNIMHGIADLAVIPRKFPRKERFVADVQISAGWMHSGYPVMIHTDSAAEMFRPDDARTIGLWGQIHELGHNQQREATEIRPNTTEATCNLWSVYVHEEVLGLNRAKAHPCVNKESRKKTVEDYVNGGKVFSDWHVWTALETYLQLQEKFGWDALKKVFGAYHNMSNFPNDNDGKMNLYCETFSQAVQKNLCGFFKAWSWPIEAATEEKLSNLPAWTDHPMAQYD